MKKNLKSLKEEVDRLEVILQWFKNEAGQSKFIYCTKIYLGLYSNLIWCYIQITCREIKTLPFGHRKGREQECFIPFSWSQFTSSSIQIILFLTLNGRQCQRQNYKDQSNSCLRPNLKPRKDGETVSLVPTEKLETFCLCVAAAGAGQWPFVVSYLWDNI